MSAQSSRSFIAIIITVLISVLLLTACSSEVPKQGIEVTDAWVRKMPPGVSSTAAFMTINNHTGEPLVLTSVGFEGAGHVMMHETQVVDGMAKMKHLESVTIKEQVKFSPGGKHVMVMGLEMPKDVMSYNISLHFANNPTLEVTAEVRNAK